MSADDDLNILDLPLDNEEDGHVREELPPVTGGVQLDMPDSPQLINADVRADIASVQSGPLELKLAELLNKDEIMDAATKIAGVYTGKKTKAYIRKAKKKVQEPFRSSHFVSSVSFSRPGLISTPCQCPSTTPYSTSTVTRPHRSDPRDQTLSTGLQKRPPTTSLEQPHLKASLYPMANEA